MITNCEFKHLIEYEFKRYFKSNREYIKCRLLSSNTYNIWRFQYALRKCEYYFQRKNNDLLNLLLFLFWRRRKNKLGRQNGMEIPENTVDIGLRIYHISPIIINRNAKIGKNCILVGNLCIGNINGANKAPIIGDNVMFGWGSTIIGDIKIAHGCKIAAGAVVNKDVLQEDSVVVGVPAKIISRDV